MANWFTQRFKKAVEVAEELFWGALIVSALGFVWVYYESLRGRPLYIAIGFFSAIILTVAIALILKSLRSRYTVETSKLSATIVEELNSRIQELEQEKTTLEKAMDDAIEAHEETTKKIERLKQEAETKDIQISARDDKLKTINNKYQWLFGVAEHDKNSISRYVYIIFREVNYEGLTELEPYIEIIFNIINASVYNIIIDKNIQDGAVYFNGIELNPKMAKLDGSLHSISRGDDEKRFLVIKQWLSPELAKRISNPQPNDELHLNRLKLIVRADNSNSEVKPQRLSLPSSIPVTAPTLKKDAKRERIKEQLEAILAEGYQVALIDRDTVYQSEVDEYNRWLTKAEGFIRVHRDDSDVKRFQQGGLRVLEEFLKNYLD